MTANTAYGEWPGVFGDAKASAAVDGYKTTPALFRDLVQVSLWMA